MNLVPNVGVLPAAVLAERLGLAGLVDARLHLAKDGANSGSKANAKEHGSCLPQSPLAPVACVHEASRRTPATAPTGSGRPPDPGRAGPVAATPAPGRAATEDRRRMLAGVTTVTTKIDRSGPAVHAALAQYAPQACALFEDEFRQALRSAEQGFDLGPAEAVLDRWWGIAAIRANPLSPAEQDLVARARAGDDTGWADGPTVGRAHR